MAVDSSGNVTIADSDNNAIEEWNATTQTLTTLVSFGLSSPEDVTVDGAGNVYIADAGNSAIKEWSPTTRTVSTLVAVGLNGPCGVAVDEAGNLFIADESAIKEQPRAFVQGGPISEGPATGSDQLLPVLPTTEVLTGVFAPSSDQPWLTLGSISGDVIPFSFTQNTGVARTGRITVLGQQIPVTQWPILPSLGTTSLVEGPASGTDSDMVAPTGAWSATSNASWLHTTSSGFGNGVAVFTFDTNSGPTRSGTLTIAGQTLTVTQAGSSYVPANPLTILVPSGQANARGMAVDGAGNVYIADLLNRAIEEWNATTQAVTTLVSSGLNWPVSVAVDSSGNVYFAADAGMIEEWNATTGTVTPLVSSGGNPTGVAVDGAGNVYIADGDNTIKEWNATTQTVTTLVSAGLNNPTGVAVDRAGNVYTADSDGLKEWNATTGTVSLLVSSELAGPIGRVAVDSSGNVYIADRWNNTIEEWSATTGTVSTLISSGLDEPFELGAVLPVWRGGGRGGQRLPHRYRQRRDQGAATGFRAGRSGQRRWGPRGRTSCCRCCLPPSR